MNLADKICEKARGLPESLAKEVLDFIERISTKRYSDADELKKAQEPSMKKIWDNEADDIWNEL
jgi:hypothetical protein